MAKDVQLENDETILHETSMGMSPTVYIFAIIGTIIPPFIWGIIFYFIMKWLVKRKASRIILTNRRVIQLGPAGMQQNYFFIDIKSIRTRGISNTRDIILSMSGKMVPRTISSVADAATFVSKAKSVMAEQAKS